MNTLKFLEDIQIDIVKHLEGDAKYIADTCGLEVLKSLLRNGLTGRQIYIGINTMNTVKKAYFLENFTGDNMNEMSRTLGISKTHLYRWLKEKDS